MWTSREFCPVRLNFEVVAAEDPTVDGPYIVLNGRTIAEFSGTAEERAEGVRLWQEALKELRR